jgi:hypothetical protein
MIISLFFLKIRMIIIIVVFDIVIVCVNIIIVIVFVILIIIYCYYCYSHYLLHILARMLSDELSLSIQHASQFIMWLI